MNRFPAVLFSLVMLATVAPPSWPCDCQPPPLKKALEGADAVFVGRVVESRVAQVDWRGPSEGIVAVFAVGRVWKGPQEHRITIVTGGGHGDCGFGFTTGDEYLVYAYRKDKGGRTELTTSICTRTKHLLNANEDIGELGRPAVEFGRGLKFGPSGELEGSQAEETNWRLTAFVVAATGIGLAAGAALGLALGRKRAQQFPPQERIPDSTDVTDPAPTSTDMTERPPHHLKRGS